MIRSQTSFTANPLTLVVGADYCLDQVYPPEVVARLAQFARLPASPLHTEQLLARPDLLKEVEVLCTTWGAPPVNEELLAVAPRLRAVLHAAGSVRMLMTDAAWERDILVASAYEANAIPVADFTVATLTLAFKRALHHMRAAARDHRLPQGAGAFAQRSDCFGNYRRCIGLVSYGAIARLVRERLRAADHEVLVHDPYLSAATARAEGVTLVSLEDLFARADAVSVHTPLLPATEGLVRGRHFAALRRDAIFLNTSRGAIVNEAEMIEVLRSRPDLQVVLDVTSPEPPVSGSALYTLPNVYLTPHIAGAFGRELTRLGDVVVAELRRYAEGASLRWQITREQFVRMA